MLFALSTLQLVGLVLAVPTALVLLALWRASPASLGGAPFQGPGGRSGPSTQSTPLPLDNVRYGSYLQKAGVTTVADLKELDAITDVHRIGPFNGEDLVQDLVDEGVDPDAVPITSEPAERAIEQ